jgi:hypothetical protein
MRTPAQRQQNFAQESMMSELAAAAKIDPLQFRVNNMSSPRLIAVINKLKEASGWETRPSPGPKASTTGSTAIQGQGCSLMLRSNAYWACVAKVTVVPKTGRVRATNVTTVVEPGIVVNPRQLQRNAEGGTVMGVSEALTEQVVLVIKSRSPRPTGSFPDPANADMPDINVIVLNNPSVGAYGGAGEGPERVFVQAAIANAVFDATGAARAGSRCCRSTSVASWSRSIGRERRAGARLPARRPFPAVSRGRRPPLAGAEVLPPAGREAKPDASGAPCTGLPWDSDRLVAGVLEREARRASQVGDDDVVAARLERPDRPAPCVSVARPPDATVAAGRRR